MSMSDYPWKDLIFEDWHIVAMYHVVINGVKTLHVYLKNGDTIISESGPDDEYLWNRLWHKVYNLSASIDPKDQHL